MGLLTTRTTLYLKAFMILQGRVHSLPVVRQAGGRGRQLINSSIKHALRYCR